jgi:hypothetical protein
MSNEVVTDPATGEPVETDAEEATIPQGPGDEGYEAPLIVPELDLEGGTVFKVGEDEYGSMSEAAEAIAPEETEPEPDEEQPEPEPNEEP